MNFNSPWRAILQATVRIEPPEVSWATAFRDAVGVAVPLAVGFAVGASLSGLNVAVGALIVSFSDLPGSYPTRLRRMLLASVVGALSAIVGALSASNDVLLILLAVVWGIGGGLLVVFGPEIGQIGVASIILLIVYSARPLSPAQAATAGALVLVGGAFQTLLATAGWPFWRFGPERAAVANVYRSLARYTRAPESVSAAPPLTTEISDAEAILSGVGESTTGRALRDLLDEVERIRLVLIALNDARRRLTSQPGAKSVRASVDVLWTAAGGVLDQIAGAVIAGRRAAALDDLEWRNEPLGPVSRWPAGSAAQEEVRLLSGILVAQLRAAVDTARQLSRPIRWRAVPIGPRLPTAVEPRAPIATLRANLTFDSAAFRHALRLAAAIGVGYAVYLGLQLPHGYWVPLTATFVLRPDFSATFVRGILRVVGTLLGLLLATVLVAVVLEHWRIEVLCVGVLVFAIRRLMAQNYGLAVVGITGLVVILLSIAGTEPRAAIVDRGVSTLIGGMLALAIYAAWPTWERTRTLDILADLLDAYQRYFDAVMANFQNFGSNNLATLRSLRMAARLARTNAEASVERLRGEPARTAEELNRAVAVLAVTNCLIRAAIALEAQSYDRPAGFGELVTRVFVADVDRSLRLLADHLRNPTQPPGEAPDLRRDLRTLAMSLGSEAAPVSLPTDAQLRRASFVAEMARIVDSLVALRQLIDEPWSRRPEWRNLAAG